MTGRQSLYRVSAATVKTIRSSQGQQSCRGHSELDIVSTAGWAANMSTTVLGVTAYWATGGEKKEEFSELLTMRTVAILSRVAFTKKCNPVQCSHEKSLSGSTGYNELKVWICQSQRAR